MSAIKIVGAQTYLQNIAGKTGPNQPNRNTHLVAPIPAGVSLFDPLGHLFSGGDHPEGPPAGEILINGQTAMRTTARPVFNDAIPKASASVRGAFGGLKPHPQSVTAPGPAGGVAQIRSNLDRGWRRLRQVFLTTGSPPGGVAWQPAGQLFKPAGATSGGPETLQPLPGLPIQVPGYRPVP